MKIVVDANIVIAAILGSRGKLNILTSQNHKFFVPAFIIDEINKHSKTICKRAGLSSEEFEEILESILTFVEIVEYSEYINYVSKAYNSMKRRDLKDHHYVACALSVNADFIWSEDKDFFEQKIVVVKNTEIFLEEGKK